MNKLFYLLKATLINNWGLNGFNKKIATSKEKKNAYNVLRIVIIGAAAISYLVTMYALLMADSLESIHMLDLILVWGIAVATLLTFMTSIYKAQGSLFSSRDYDLLMSLPIKPSVILTSKLINLLLINWVYTAFAVVPASIIYFLRTPDVSWIYFIFLILSIFFIPLIPVVVASLFAVVISFFASKFKHKNLITLLGTMSLLVLFLVGSFQMESIANYAFAHAESIYDGLEKIYPPMIYLSNALANTDSIEFIKFVLVSILPFILFVYFISKLFTRINLRLGESYKKGNYKVKSLKTNSVIQTLTRKEIARYFSTPVYVMNTAVGMVLSVMGAFATLFIDKKTITTYMEIPYVERIFPLVVLAVMIFSIGLSSTTSSSISLEGKNLWITKSLPISEKDIFLGKINLSLLITLPLTIIVNFIFFFGLKYSISHLIWNLLISSLYCFFGAIIGLVINLYFPKLEWTNTTVVVKQSASVIVSLLVTFSVIALPIFVYVTLDVTNITLFLSVLLIVLITLLSISWYILNTKGIEKFRQL